MRPYKLVCFLARAHGLDGLKALVKDDRYQPIALFTHKYKPKSQDTSQGEREDFKAFEQIACQHNIPLHTVDQKGSNFVDLILKSYADADCIASISWRTILPGRLLDMPKFGAVNLHRGKLPEYAGAYPIEQALNDNQSEIVITAHKMVEEVDAGEILDISTYPANVDTNHSVLENVERLKIEITPLFGPLLISALEKNILQGS